MFVLLAVLPVTTPTQEWRCCGSRATIALLKLGPKRGCQSQRNASGTCTKIRFWVTGGIISTIWTSILKGNDGNVHIHTYSYLMWCLYRSFQRQKDVSGIYMTGSCISSLYISPFSCCSWRMFSRRFYLLDHHLPLRGFYASNQNYTWIQADLEYPKFKLVFQIALQRMNWKKGGDVTDSFPPDLLRYVAQQRALVVLMVWMAQWSQGRCFSW